MLNRFPCCRRYIRALAPVSLSLLLALAALAAGPTDYDVGVKAYQARNFKLAAQSFQKAVAGGKAPALTWLYLGHAYSGDKDSVHAIAAYRYVADAFPASPEAQLAIQCMLKLDPRLGVKYQTTPPPITQGAAAASSAVEGKKALIDRIVVVPPAAGHPAVSRATVETVRTVVSKLPRHMYQYLSDGGATINLAPNIEDKWPGSGDGIKPTDTSSTMGEEPGRTYGHDVHIYEREKVRGQNVLKEAREQKEIARICYHELGHAVDAVSGEISKTPQFAAVLNDDLSRMTDEVKSAGAYYTAPGEAFAETTGVLMGSPDGNAIVEHMPKTKQFIKDKFHL